MGGCNPIWNSCPCMRCGIGVVLRQHSADRHLSVSFCVPPRQNVQRKLIQPVIYLGDGAIGELMAGRHDFGNRIAVKLVAVYTVANCPCDTGLLCDARQASALTLQHLCDHDDFVLGVIHDLFNFCDFFCGWYSGLQRTRIAGDVRQCRYNSSCIFNFSSDNSGCGLRTGRCVTAPADRNAHNSCQQEDSENFLHCSTSLLSMRKSPELMLQGSFPVVCWLILTFLRNC